MSVITTLSKECKDGRISCWTFTQNAAGKFHRYNDVKLVSLKDQSDVDNCIQWFLDHGFSETQQLSLNLA